MDNKAFDNIRIAQGYAKRPWIHKDVIKQLICDYPQKLKYRNGLDVVLDCLQKH